MSYNHACEVFLYIITRELSMSTYNFIFKVLEKKMKDTNFSIWNNYDKIFSIDYDESKGETTMANNV